MKHVFIINPTAGKKDCTARMMETAKALAARHQLDVECILTKRPGHAMETVRSLAERGEPLRIYACGGDGTANEAANGSAGFDNAAMTCIPVGTGNDFLKNFGETAPMFSEPENLWDGPAFPLDVIDCNGRLALTVACSGFDAQVADDVHKYGNFPLLGGQGSYIVSLGVNFLIRGLRHSWTVIVDGQPLPENSFVLAAVCNGRYYGGGFNPSRSAMPDDGELEFIIVRAVSRLTVAALISAYAKGGAPDIPEKAIVRRGRSLRVLCEREEMVNLDGERMDAKDLSIRLSGKRVNFFFPQGTHWDPARRR